MQKGEHRNPQAEDCPLPYLAKQRNYTEQETSVLVVLVTEASSHPGASCGGAYDELGVRSPSHDFREYQMRAQRFRMFTFVRGCRSLSFSSFTPRRRSFPYLVLDMFGTWPTFSIRHLTDEITRSVRFTFPHLLFLSKR